MTRIAHHLILFAFTGILSACDSKQTETATDSPATNEPSADLVLIGGSIATVDPNIGNVEALAVVGYQISAVGSDEEISAYIGPETRVIELQGRFVMPGFIEGHGHFLGLGESLRILDLSEVRDWNEVVSMVASAADKTKAGEWITGRGWHQDKWQSVPDDAVEGVPVNDSLSAVSPANPVRLTHASGHAYFVNDAALEAADIGKDTADPRGGTIVRDEKGEATGLLRETARNMVDGAERSFVEKLPAADRLALDRERVRMAGELALRSGVTSFQDAGARTRNFINTIEFLKTLEAEGELPIRLYMMARSVPLDALDKTLPFLKMLPEDNDFLVVRSMKKQIDGALGAHGAWLLEPYTDIPETDGLVLETVEDIEATAEYAVQHGYQLNTHAIGDRAVREVLDLYERVWEKMDVDGSELRWRIEHAQHIMPEDVPRFGELGVIASVQAVHGTSDGPWIPTRLGDERAEATSQPWRDLFRTGAVVTNGTDVPVERIDPIASYYSSVTRMMVNGEHFYPEHVMTREEALQTYTINGAYAAFEEELKGSLTPGKYADFVVLSQNLLTVDAERIPDTRVEMTFVGGELRYQRETVLSE
ncbi:MAG: amidohydrolase [Gammaproteobacteria bacterium]|nr:amidohydrolase [Gammaproteobacteria bacterium]